MFSEYELLDVFGPLQMLSTCNSKLVSLWPAFRFVVVGDGRRSFGPLVVADFEAGDPDIPPVDVLFIPGGLGWKEAVRDEAAMRWLRTAAQQARHAPPARTCH